VDEVEEPLNPLPVHIQSAFERWRRAQPFETSVVRWLPGGRSGAKLAVARQFSRPKVNRQVVLKFLPRGLERELDGIGRALTESPAAFSTAHLVEMMEQPVTMDTWSMITLRVAGGDLSRMRPLVELAHDPRLPAACETLAAAVLRSWNPGPAHQPVEMTAAEYLGLLLGDRPDRLARVREWAPPALHLRITDFELLPNPLSFLAGRFTGTGRVPIHRGRAHGDLNVRNVLLPPEDPERFQLIDYGDYAGDAPLARDPMHLLSSLAVEWLRGTVADSPQRAALATAILTPAQAMDGPAHHEAKVSAALHRIGRSQAETDGFGGEWHLQTLLSLIGCALMFAGRALPDAGMKEWFFDLAARAAIQYLKESHDSYDADVPAGRHALGVPRERADVAGVLARQLTHAQQRMGNGDRLAGVVLDLLGDEERFVLLAPCRVMRSARGSAVLVVSDSHVRTAELDDRLRPFDVQVLTHDEIRDVHVRPGIRSDVVIVTNSGEVVAGALMPEQAKDVAQELRRLTGGPPQVRDGWRELASTLKGTTFDGTTPLGFAVSSQDLLLELDKQRPPYRADPVEVDRLIGLLRVALDRGSRVSASESEVYTARTDADRIRRRLLDKLT
jgi:hypothetical protein